MLTCPAGVAGLAPLWLPAVAGGMLGGLYSVAHHHIGERRLWRAPAGPLRVVITGGRGSSGSSSCGQTPALTVVATSPTSHLAPTHPPTHASNTPGGSSGIGKALAREFLR